jgi:hypothetical protein
MKIQIANCINRLDRQVTVRYWLSALSFSIQNAIAESILKRSLLVNSAQSHQAHAKDRSSHHIYMFDRMN